MNKKHLVPGIIISIDFEMRWGVHDIYGCNIDGYRANLENVRYIIPKMIQLFRERNIRATWATVGALALDSWDEYFSFAPSPPIYENNKLTIDPAYADIDPDGLLHFAPDLVRNIINTPGQELGSHSFSHLYFREKGVTVQDFIADSGTVSSVFSDKFNINPVSLVFPKNQIAFESILPECGIRIWRGNENRWYYESVTTEHRSYTSRLMRLYESVNPWVNRSNPIDKNVSYSSMFIRFNLPEALWALHIKRLKSEFKSLSGNNICHIWWHPHNLGKDMNARMSRLERVLDLVAQQCEKSDVHSLNMADCVLP